MYIFMLQASRLSDRLVLLLAPIVNIHQHLVSKVLPPSSQQDVVEHADLRRGNEAQMNNSSPWWSSCRTWKGSSFLFHVPLILLNLLQNIKLTWVRIFLSLSISFLLIPLSFPLHLLALISLCHSHHFFPSHAAHPSNPSLKLNYICYISTGL